MIKVREHDYFAGKLRGAYNSYCNLNYRYPRFLPVYFYNLSGFDNHLFIKE